jgi:hypothetical protein
MREQLSKTGEVAGIHQLAIAAEQVPDGFVRLAHALPPYLGERRT